MDHDRFSNDDFAGNGFIRLMSIPQVRSEENCGGILTFFTLTYNIFRREGKDFPGAFNIVRY